MGIEGTKVLSNIRTMGLLFLLSTPIWLFETGLYYLIAFSFDLDSAHTSLWELAITMLLLTAISNIGSSIPAAPGGLGIFELVARETLVLLPLATVDRSVAGAYVAVVHAALLLPVIIVGQLFLWLQHISLGSLINPEQTNEPQSTISETSLLKGKVENKR